MAEAGRADVGRHRKSDVGQLILRHCKPGRAGDAKDALTLQIGGKKEKRRTAAVEVEVKCGGAWFVEWLWLFQTVETKACTD